MNHYQWINKQGDLVKTKGYMHTVNEHGWIVIYQEGGREWWVQYWSSFQIIPVVTEDQTNTIA